MDPPPGANLMIRRRAVLVQFGRSLHDIDAAHPMRLGLRVTEINLLGGREFADDRLRHVVEKQEGYEAEAVALFEVATVLGPALVGLAELSGDGLPRIHCVC